MLGCPKGLLNGPCGGVREGGICESGSIKCPWYEAVIREGIRLATPKLDEGFRVRDFKPLLKDPYSTFLSKLSRGNDVLVAEIVPSLSSLKYVKECGKLADALSITDNPAGTVKLSPLAFVAMLKGSIESDVIIHLSCRGKDRDTLTSTILGALGLGVRNFLAVTGDLPKSNLSKTFFDLDSTRLIYLARLLSDKGLNYRGEKVKVSSKFHVGATLNPHLRPVKVEVVRALRKVRAGAEFLITQPVYEFNPLRELLNNLIKLNIDVPVVMAVALPTHPKALGYLRDMGVKVSKVFFKGFIRSYKSSREVGALKYCLGETSKLVEEALSSNLLIRGIYITTVGKHSYLPYALKSLRGIVGS